MPTHPGFFKSSPATKQSDSMSSVALREAATLTELECRLQNMEINAETLRLKLEEKKEQRAALLAERLELRDEANTQRLNAELKKINNYLAVNEPVFLQSLDTIETAKNSLAKRKATLNAYFESLEIDQSQIQPA